MARRPSKKGEVVDGFTTLKAAQRAVAARGRGGAKESQPQPKLKEPVAPEPKKPAAPAGQMRIDRTARPTRHDIVCYECGFAFFLTGAVKSTYCPKCRCILDGGERAIDGEWADSIKTIGAVTIGPSGVVNGGRILANKVVLSGRIAAGRVEVAGALEICPGGSYEPGAVVAKCLVVRRGAKVVFAGKTELRNLEIMGEVEGKVTVTDSTAIRAGGFFRGELAGRSLTAEDGAGMDALLNIGPDAVKAGEEKEAGTGASGRQSRRNAA